MKASTRRKTRHGFSSQSLLLAGLIMAPQAVHAASLGSSSDRMSQDLRVAVRALKSRDVVRVSVQTDPEATSAQLVMLPQLGGRVLGEPFALVRGYAAEIPAGPLTELASRPAVRRLSPDREVFSTMDVALPVASTAEATPFTPPLPFTGAGVTVALVDSGITSNADLKDSGGKDRVINYQNYVAGAKADDYGHGTHVAGILGGNGKSSSSSFSFRT